MPMRTDCSTTHVIFNFCGTIIDLVAVIEEILAENALDFDKESKGHIIDKLREADSFDEICNEISNNFELKVEGHPNYKDVDVVKKNLLKWFREKSVPMISGAQKMISHLHKHNIPMAIVTNLDSRLFEALMERTVGFQEKDFSHFVCGGTDKEIKENRPAPNLYKVCAKRFNHSPNTLDSCVVFEHTIRGITRALDTGMKTVLVTDKTIRELDGTADKVTRIIKSFNNFCPESIGLPSYELQ